MATTVEAAEGEGKSSAEALIKHDPKAVETIHRQLEALSKEDVAAPKGRCQNLAKHHLNALNSELSLVQKKILPYVEISSGGQKTNKFEVVGTTADTSDPTKKEGLVVAVGRKEPGKADHVVILGRDGKFHDAEVVYGADKKALGYKIAKNGETYDNEEKLKEKFSDKKNAHAPSVAPENCYAETKDGVTIWTKKGASPPQIMQVETSDHKFYRVQRDEAGAVVKAEVFANETDLKENRPRIRVCRSSNPDYQTLMTISQDGRMTMTRYLKDKDNVMTAFRTVMNPDGSESRSVLKPHTLQEDFG